MVFPSVFNSPIMRAWVICIREFLVRSFCLGIMIGEESVRFLKKRGKVNHGNMLDSIVSQGAK